MKNMFFFILLIFLIPLNFSVYGTDQQNLGITLENDVPLFRVPTSDSKEINKIRKNAAFTILEYSTLTASSLNMENYFYVKIKLSDATDDKDNTNDIIGWVEEDKIAVNITCRTLMKNETMSSLLPYSNQQITVMEKIDTTEDIIESEEKLTEKSGILWLAQGRYSQNNLREILFIITVKDRHYFINDRKFFNQSLLQDIPYIKKMFIKDILGNGTEEIIIDYNYFDFEDESEKSAVIIIAGYEDEFKTIYNLHPYDLNNAGSIRLSSLEIDKNQLTVTEIISTDNFTSDKSSVYKTDIQYYWDNSAESFREERGKKEQVLCKPITNLKISEKPESGSQIISLLKSSKKYLLYGIPLKTATQDYLYVNDDKGMWLPISVDFDETFPDFQPRIWGWAFSWYLESEEEVLNAYMKGAYSNPLMSLKNFTYVQFK